TPGTNVLQAHATDATGNLSLTASNRVIYVEMITLTDYYPLPLNAEWLYEGWDWDGNPAKQRCRVESTNASVVLYTGRTAPRSYTTNSVRKYAAYLNPDTLAPYDEWLDYFASGASFGFFGNDDDDEQMRADRGYLCPIQVAMGATVALTRDVYLNGVYAGVATLSLQFIEKTSVTVPAGTFPDVLRVRISFKTPDGTQVHDDWWARSVGCVKAQGISGDGVPERWELIEYSMPTSTASALLPLQVPEHREADRPCFLQFEGNPAGLPVAGGRVELRLSAPVGHTVVLESSEDLLHWTPVQTNIVTANGVSLSAPMNTHPAQFFRTRLQ
ncbi:MAG: hypothetical protein JXQ71_06870, partial [Verrucomicrobia bacterium]|nr:hypothetical protein [Verrucomicrobiota bacterium]